MSNYKNVFQQEAQLGKNVTARVNVGTTPSATVQAGAVTANVSKDLLTGKKDISVSTPYKYGRFGFQRHNGVNALFINFHKKLR
tara:strand:- start:1488 stop:1739 length:252 start_codon:yes stop_codon:yes gene_type:complete